DQTQRVGFAAKVQLIKSIVAGLRALDKSVAATSAGDIIVTAQHVEVFRIRAAPVRIVCARPVDHRVCIDVGTVPDDSIIKIDLPNSIRHLVGKDVRYGDVFAGGGIADEKRAVGPY